MPRIRKSLPANRQDYSFGDLVYWHLFEFGTRPNVSPDARVGRPWRPEDICSRLGKTDKTLRNWVNDKSLPDDISELCQALFGDAKAWEEARHELHASLLKAGKTRGTRKPPEATVSSDEPVSGPDDVDTSPGSDLTQRPDDAEDSHRSKDEPDDEAVRRPPNAKGSRELVHVRPIRLRAVNDNPGQQGNSRYRRAVASLVAGVCVFFGLYAWLTSGRQPVSPVPSQPKVAAIPEPKKDVTPPRPVPPIQSQPEPVRPAPPPPAVQLPPPAPKEPPKVTEPEIVPPKPRELTQEEKRRIEEDRRESERMEARRRAFDREKLAKEAEALRRDRENDSRARELAQREDDAREAAGLNYRIQEHRRIDKSSYAHVLAASVGDCANACTADPSCDAFGFYREQYGPESKRKRVCYLFSKPFDPPTGFPGYVHGEPIEPRKSAELRGKSANDDFVVRVQAKKSEPNTDDSLTRCATGPVKVTGFKLTCDQTLGGGTTLGSTRLSYTVANINECASKCKPVKQCVGFAFNAGDREGQHYCILFGPTPEARDSKGWITGVR